MALLAGILALIGLYDLVQTQHAVLRNYPISAHIRFLLEAMVHTRRQCPDALLLVAGEGPAKVDLQARVDPLGLADAVRFIGYLDRRDALPDCYAAADVFAFASRTETQGLVLLEAMAAGLPVVALSEMGTTDILDAGRGAISPPAIPQVFGEALAQVLNHPSAWQHLGDDAAQYAREWSDIAMASRMAELYRRMATPEFASEQPLTAPRSKSAWGATA